MTNNTYSPLEQFELLLPFPFLQITNLIFFLLLSSFILIFFYAAAGYSFFTYLSFFLEKIFNFVANLSKINIKYPEFYMIYFYLFIVVLVNNLVGMIPYSYTTTSSAVVTFFLSIGVFIGISLVGCDYLGYHFLNLFLPSGAPIRILKLLIFIETVSYFIRALSLGVRLFANMVSGHSLLKILSGFA